MVRASSLSSLTIVRGPVVTIALVPSGVARSLGSLLLCLRGTDLLNDSILDILAVNDLELSHHAIQGDM